MWCEGIDVKVKYDDASTKGRNSENANIAAIFERASLYAQIT